MVVKLKYIRRSSKGITIKGIEEQTIQISLKKYFNLICLQNGSSYQGRIESMKHMQNTKGLVPLFVNKDLVLLFTKNIREYDVILVNYYRIISVSQYEKYTKIIFDDFEELLLYVSYNKFLKQFRMAKKTISLLV